MILWPGALVAVLSWISRVRVEARVWRREKHEMMRFNEYLCCGGWSEVRSFGVVGWRVEWKIVNAVICERKEDVGYSWEQPPYFMLENQRFSAITCRPGSKTHIA